MGSRAHIMAAVKEAEEITRTVENLESIHSIYRVQRV